MAIREALESAGPAQGLKNFLLCHYDGAPNFESILGLRLPSAELSGRQRRMLPRRKSTVEGSILIDAFDDAKSRT